MERLGDMNENKYIYGKRVATVYRFDNGVRIIGFKQEDYFDLRVLTIGFNTKRIGLGESALKLVRPLFKIISVNEINEGALPFWTKMKERGLVNNLGTVKWEGNYDYTMSC
ncbi:hypothetical protein ACOBQJ_04055 [Pelotomaculum propionicicum]|uniref:hypothetical protein n=1 Tax=Pelotomaculum propionicicum TaxID=258475 RepID=UPI003B8291F0